MKEITFCLTSCNRFDLLEQTLDSFFALNTYPIKRFIVTEDSAVFAMKEKILGKYGDRIELIFNEVNLGIYKSIDNMYKLVDTEYIFHCEDDWAFLSNPNFVQESIDVLEERKDIHRVCFRKDMPAEWLEEYTQSTKNSIKFNLMKCPHMVDWCGFSNNPGLRRKADYDRMFPNGYAAFTLPDQPSVFTEHNCNLHATKFGYRAAVLKNRTSVHLGEGRSTIA